MTFQNSYFSYVFFPHDQKHRLHERKVDTTTQNIKDSKVDFEGGIVPLVYRTAVIGAQTIRFVWGNIRFPVREFSNK
jgi:hypothetical protein